MEHGKATMCREGSGLGVCDLRGVLAERAQKHFPAGTPALLSLWGRPEPSSWSITVPHSTSHYGPLGSIPTLEVTETMTGLWFSV